jgi:hypothetical protein
MTTTKTLEKRLYPLVLAALREMFERILNRKDIVLELTADMSFSNRIKDAIPRNRDIIFSFLKSSRPDITGFVPPHNKEEHTPTFTRKVTTRTGTIIGSTVVPQGPKFIVAEVKSKPLTIEDIYQVKRYRDLFDASYALLISDYEIPSELKRLSGVAKTLLATDRWGHPIRLGQYDESVKAFVEWFPTHPT